MAANERKIYHKNIKTEERRWSAIWINQPEINASLNFSIYFLCGEPASTEQSDHNSSRNSQDLMCRSFRSLVI